MNTKTTKHFVILVILVGFVPERER